MKRKSEDELRKMHWRDRYEYEAQRQEEAYENFNEQRLIERIDKDLLDPYFAIWRAIGKKGTLENSAMTLWRYLQRSPGDKNMLNRYHCAAALFAILGMPDPASQNSLRKRVQWDHEGEPARQEALLELREMLEARLGESRGK
ncbi:MAG: hypothetical protein ACK2UH_02280 [Candidatus Promineifilaceae bacterium]|jgi:hypothetical protein